MANFGTLGDLNQYRGSQRPTGLPQWLLDQFTPNTTVDEGGGQNTTYSLNNNPFGGFQRDGHNYVQVGANHLRNPSSVTNDPELGDITDTSNVLDLDPNGPNYWMLAAVLSAGLLGGAAGLGAASTEGGAAAAGAGAAGGSAAGAGGLSTIDTGLSGLFAGTPELAPATAQYAAAGAFGGAGGAAAGGAGGAGSGGLLGTEGAGAGGAGAAGQPWYQPALNYAQSNPLNIARLGAGLYSMATANNQHPGSSSNSSGPGGVANVAGLQQFNPMQAMGQFAQNPYLLAQMNNVPFMTGANRGLLGN